MIKMNLGKKIVSIILSCAVLAGVFLSPVAEVRSAAATYRGNTWWVSNGREVYINSIGGEELDLDDDYYFYAVDHDILLTIESQTGIGGDTVVYKDDEYYKGVADEYSDDFSVITGQALKTRWSSPQKVYLYTGYPIIFKDKGDADFSGEMAPENSFSLNSDPSLAFEYAINKNTEKLDKAVIGQNVVMEFGKWNSFSKEFMTMVKEKVAEGVSVTLKFWYNGVEYTITIPAYSLVDTSLDWYGPFCMYQIYELGIPVTKQ